MLCKWIAPATRETLNVRRPGKVQPGNTVCVSHRCGGILVHVSMPQAQIQQRQEYLQHALQMDSASY